MDAAAAMDVFADAAATAVVVRVVPCVVVTETSAFPAIVVFGSVVVLWLFSCVYFPAVVAKVLLFPVPQMLGSGPVRVSNE